MNMISGKPVAGSVGCGRFGDGVRVLCGLVALVLVSDGVAASPVGPAAHQFGVTVTHGRADSLDGRLLAIRDGRGIVVESREVLGYQTVKLRVAIPKPGRTPEKVDAARVVLGIHGNEAHSIGARVWYPESRVWQRLDHEPLPVRKGGHVICELGNPKRSLAAEVIEMELEIKNPKRPAEPFSVNLDAVAFQVRVVLDEPVDPHAAAERAAARTQEDGDPYVRVHFFQGKSSGNYEKHIRRMWRNWRRSFGASAKTQKDAKVKVPTGQHYPGYGF